MSMDVLARTLKAARRMAQQPEQRGAGQAPEQQALRAEPTVRHCTIDGCVYAACC